MVVFTFNPVTHPTYIVHTSTSYLHLPAPLSQVVDRLQWNSIQKFLLHVVWFIYSNMELSNLIFVLVVWEKKGQFCVKGKFGKCYCRTPSILGATDEGINVFACFVFISVWPTILTKVMSLLKNWIHNRIHRSIHVAHLIDSLYFQAKSKSLSNSPRWSHLQNCSIHFFILLPS